MIERILTCQVRQLSVKRAACTNQSRHSSPGTELDRDTVASLLLRGSGENAWKMMPVKSLKFAKCTPGKRLQCSYLFGPSAFGQIKIVH